MLNQDQLNKLQKIKDAYKAGVIKSDKDYLNMLTDFMNDEAPDEVRKAYYDDEETDATRQYEREIFADTPWATSDISDMANGEKLDIKILFNDLPEFYQRDIVRNLIGSDDDDAEDFDEYMSVLSERNEPFGGFSREFAKKYGIKPYEEDVNGTVSDIRTKYVLSDAGLKQIKRRFTNKNNANVKYVLSDAGLKQIKRRFTNKNNTGNNHNIIATCNGGF